MTVHQLRVPVASVQGTLALDLSPRHAPPELPEDCLLYTSDAADE